MKSRPVWAEIDLAAIVNNLNELRRVTRPPAGMMAVVKANAYGHGAVPVSKTVLANGADCLGVAIFNEARELREAGIRAPILILGYTPAEQALETVKLDVAQTIYSLEGAEALSAAAVKLGKKVKVHIKIDTGMSRLGFKIDAGTLQEVMKIAALPGIEVEGMMTHFAVADIADKEFTYSQSRKFDNLVLQLKEMGFNCPVKHVANSAAIIDLPGMHLDMVRAGISLYGLYPSRDVMKHKINLIPAMSLRARVAHLKTVPPGTGISYGRTYTTDQETIVATVPVGYADGYSRRLSNKAHVLVNGRRAPVIGTVCMDQFMIDVTNIPGVKVGDEVTLMGRQGNLEVTADMLADLLGTINYEIVCMVSARVPRVYLNQDV